MTTWDEALGLLWDRSDWDRGFITDPFAHRSDPGIGLKRTTRVLERLNEPHLRLRVAHVAGSKGKGSTSAFLASMACSAGYRTGLYTSPHLHSYVERIRVDGAPVDELAFADLAGRVITAAVQVEADAPDLGRVTTFEVLTVMALLHFAEAGCELAVVEVGLGGTLDATNVVLPAACAITRLDLEHTAILGQTIEEIAANKAGIIKPGVPVMVSPQQPEALEVIEARALELESPVGVAGRDWTWHGGWRGFSLTGPWGTWDDLRCGMPGEHQVENAATAVATAWALRGCGIGIGEGAVRDGLASTRWPGRIEVVEQGGRTIVIDGAHTPSSAEALARTLVDLGISRADFVIGMLRDKREGTLLEPLRGVMGTLAVAPLRSPRSQAVEDLVAGAEELGITAHPTGSIAEALGEALRTGSRRPVVVTGSLSAAAEAREALGLQDARTSDERA